MWFIVCYGVTCICGLVYILFYGVFFSCVIFERRMEGGIWNNCTKTCEIN